jgi:uridine kinase
MSKPFCVGIAGGTSSGKTTVAHKIYKSLAPARVALLDQDSYYYDLSHLSQREREAVNFDHPDAFDNALLAEHIRALSEGRTIYKPVYSYTDYARTQHTREVLSAHLIIVEGILVLESPLLRSLFDFKIFVSAEDDVRLMRRMRRDIASRGRSLERVLEQYEHTVRPMHHTFVEPSKRYADIIIPNGGENDVAISMISQALQAHLQRSAAESLSGKDTP